MPALRSSNWLLVLVALAVGYGVGLTRRDEARTAATAGAPVVHAEGVLTTTAEGGDLIVWTMRQGHPTRAARYTLSTTWNSSGGGMQPTRWMLPSTYELPADANGK